MFIVKYPNSEARRSFNRRPSHVVIDQADAVIEVRVIKGVEDPLEPDLVELMELLRKIAG